MLQKTAADGTNRRIVFINGYMPTKADRALAELHGTACFRNCQIASAVEPHEYAVAVAPEKCEKDKEGNYIVEPAVIPEGYTLYVPKTAQASEASAPAPSRNPAGGLVPPPGARSTGLAANGE